MANRDSRSRQQRRGIQPAGCHSPTPTPTPRIVLSRRRMSTLAAAATTLSLISYILMVQLTTLINGLSSQLDAGSPSPGTLESLVATPVLGLGVLLASWWALSLWFLTAALLLPSTGAASRTLVDTVHRCGPRTLRRLAVVGFGVGLAFSAVPAQAADDPGVGWVATPPAADPTNEQDPQAIPAPTPEALPTDLFTVVPPAVDATPPTHPEAETSGDNRTADPAPDDAVPDAPNTPSGPSTNAPPTLTVTVGDSLWRIAAAHLPATATTSDIATTWRAWYELNRTIIGPDPDLLIPGQVLTIPDAAHQSTT